MRGNSSISGKAGARGLKFHPARSHSSWDFGQGRLTDSLVHRRSRSSASSPALPEGPQTSHTEQPPSEETPRPPSALVGLSEESHGGRKPRYDGGAQLSLAFW